MNVCLYKHSINKEDDKLLKIYSFICKNIDAANHVIFCDQYQIYTAYVAIFHTFYLPYISKDMIFITVAEEDINTLIGLGYNTKNMILLTGTEDDTQHNNEYHIISTAQEDQKFISNIMGVING